MIALKPHLAELLVRIGDQRVTAADMSVAGVAMTRLVALGLLKVVAAPTSSYPSIYATTEDGKAVIARLTAAPAPHECEAQIAKIKRLTADHYHIPVEEMVSASKSRVIARPRQVAMYLTRNLTPKSLPAIGRYFGGRDHTTVIHAVRQVEALMAHSSLFREDVESLLDVVTGGKAALTDLREMTDVERLQDARTGSAMLRDAIARMTA